MKKVLFLTYSPAPYRVAFFEELGKYCELEVIYEMESNDVSNRNQNWFINEAHNFSVVKTKRIKLKQYVICSNIISILKNGNYDEIIMGTYSSLTAMLAITYMKLKNIPFWLNSDGGFIKEKENVVKRAVKTHFISAASYYLASGKHTKKYLEYYGAEKNTVYIYPFSSYLKSDFPDSLITESERKQIRNDIGISEKYVVLSVGQFIFRKGFDVLIKAASQLKTTVGIYIVGDTPTEEYLKLCKEYNVTNVHFIGYKSKNELIEYYKAADLFVCPTREDIWGLVINEALTFGLPVITTARCGAGLELIKNGYNGEIIPCEDYNSLAEAIDLFFEDWGNIEQLRNNAFESVGNYNIENEAFVHAKLMGLLN